MRIYPSAVPAIRYLLSDVMVMVLIAALGLNKVICSIRISFGSGFNSKNLIVWSSEPVTMLSSYN